MRDCRPSGWLAGWLTVYVDADRSSRLTSATVSNFPVDKRRAVHNRFPYLSCLGGIIPCLEEWTDGQTNGTTARHTDRRCERAVCSVSAFGVRVNAAEKFRLYRQQPIKQSDPSVQLKVTHTHTGTRKDRLLACLFFSFLLLLMRPMLLGLGTHDGAARRRLKTVDGAVRRQRHTQRRKRRSGNHTAWAITPEQMESGGKSEGKSLVDLRLNRQIITAINALIPFSTPSCQS